MTLPLPLPPLPWVEFIVSGKPVPRQLDLVPVNRTKTRWKQKLADTSVSYQIRVARAAHKAFREAGALRIDGPLEVEIVVVMPRLKRQKKPGRALSSTTPDLDKVLRNIFDALSLRGATGERYKVGTPNPRHGVIWDDARVCRSSQAKHLAAEDEDAHTLIRLRPVREGA